MDDTKDTLDAIKLNVLRLQQNSCANCGIEFSDDDIAKFRYLLSPDQGGAKSEENVEAVCDRCFREGGSDGI